MDTAHDNAPFSLFSSLKVLASYPDGSISIIINKASATRMMVGGVVLHLLVGQVHDQIATADELICSTLAARHKGAIVHHDKCRRHVM